MAFPDSGNKVETQLGVSFELLSKECSDAAKDLIFPILTLPGTQAILTSCMRSTEKSLEDWIWDPPIRSMLERIREENDHENSTASNLKHAFDTSNVISPFSTAKPTEKAATIEDVHELKQAAKQSFKAQNFHKALRQYTNALDLLKTIVDSSTTNDVHLFSTLCCNAAVAALKLEKWTVAQNFSSRALKVCPELHKAIYCQSKALMMEHRYEEARAVLESVSESSPELEKLSAQMEKMQVALESRTFIPAPPLPDIPSAAAETPNVALPLSHSDAISAIHDFAQAAKLDVSMHYEKLENDKDGRSVFSCAYHIDNLQFTSKFSDTSKKKAQRKAADAFVKKIWQVRRNAETLTAADIENAKATKTCTVTTNEEDSTRVIPFDELGEIRSLYTHQACAISQLNSLSSQYPIVIREEFTKSTSTNSTMTNASAPPPLFDCKIYINEKLLGTGSGKRKKIAKKLACEKALLELKIQTKGKVWKE